MAWITTKDGRQVNTEWFEEDERKKYEQIEKNQKEAAKLNENIDSKVLSKFSKKVQSKITFAEKDRYGKYHIVVNDEKYGEASFHGTNFGDMKWEISEFLKDGSRY